MKTKGLIWILIFAGVFTLISGCGNKEKVISVGAKQFTEGYIVAEMVAQILEDSGYEIRKDFGMSSFVIRKAILSGQIDCYPEYTGTAWAAYLEKEEKINDAEELYKQVKQADEKNGVIWLDRIPVNNTYALAVTRKFADYYQVETLSDLADIVTDDPNAFLFGVSHEFYERPDGFKKMAEVYGMNVPEGKVKTMEIGLTYEAVSQDQIDIPMVFSTDGKLKKYQLIPLEDDKNFFPVYNIAVNIRSEVFEEYPGIQKVLKPLVSLITEEVLIELNYQVDALKKEPDEVAHSFLVDNGLLKE